MYPLSRRHLELEANRYWWNRRLADGRLFGRFNCCDIDL